jgi:hypothetical protein
MEKKDLNFRVFVKRKKRKKRERKKITGCIIIIIDKNMKDDVYIAR